MKVNKLSLKQGGGNVEQPSHQMPDGTIMPGETHQEAEQQPVIQAPAQQEDQAIAQITEMVNSALQEGEDPVNIVMALIEQEVDQNIIAQAFMSGGYAEEDVVTLFETVQQKSQPPAAASAEQQTKDPQEIARNQSLEEEEALAEVQQAETLAAEQDAMSQNLAAKSGIEIKPENEGKFTKWAKARGMSVSEAYNKVMSNKEKYATNVVKMANFAKNAAGWNKQDGGDVSNYTEGVRQREGSYNPPNRKYTLDPRFKKEGGEFEPHFMYKGERKIRAKDMATHLRLKEAGYNHDAPKAATGAETSAAKEFYETTGVVKRGDVFTNTAPRYTLPVALDNGKDFSVAKALSTLADVGDNLFSGKVDENGLKIGSFRDWQAKGAVEDQIKGNYYNYEIETDANDFNQYADDNLGLYNSSKTGESIRTLDQYKEDVNENSRVNYNVETGDYDFVQSSRKINKNLPGINQNALKGENLNYFNEVDDKTKQEIIDFGKSGAPDGTSLSIDRRGAVGYVDPDVENANEYDSMMGYNQVGKDRRLKSVNKLDSIGIQPLPTNIEVPSMIPTNQQGMFDESMLRKDNTGPPYNDQAAPKDFKQWFVENASVIEGMSQSEQREMYEESIQKESMFREGGSLPKAQVGTGGMFAGTYDALEEFMSNIEQEDEKYNKVYGDMDGAGSDSFPLYRANQKAIEDQAIADLNNAVDQGQGTDYKRDTEMVKRAQIDEGTYGTANEQKCPEGQEYDEAVGACVMKTVEVTDVATEPSDAKDLPFTPPKVKRTNKLQGGINKFLDSKEVKAFGDVSEGIVQIAGVANDFFRDRSVNQAVASNRANATADEVYGVNEDPFMKRGAWDVNTGTFGSEGQRTVRTNMGVAKQGGGINNAGFKALPPQAQQNILDNMLYGGDPNPGITALRKVAPQVVSKMGYKGGGETINVNSTILAKLIAAGADIEIL